MKLFHSVNYYFNLCVYFCQENKMYMITDESMVIKWKSVQCLYMYIPLNKCLLQDHLHMFVIRFRSINKYLT
ncbi:unnamed protein product [Heterobilharzia americana]|nr:unnamed protein product [Heterobilharzia americana]